MSRVIKLLTLASCSENSVYRNNYPTLFLPMAVNPHKLSKLFPSTTEPRLSDRREAPDHPASSPFASAGTPTQADSLPRPSDLEEGETTTPPRLDSASPRPLQIDENPHENILDSCLALYRSLLTSQEALAALYRPIPPVPDSQTALYRPWQTPRRTQGRIPRLPRPWGHLQPSSLHGYPRVSRPRRDWQSDWKPPRRPPPFARYHRWIRWACTTTPPLQ